VVTRPACLTQQVLHDFEVTLLSQSPDLLDNNPTIVMEILSLGMKVSQVAGYFSVLCNTLIVQRCPPYCMVTLILPIVAITLPTPSYRTDEVRVPVVDATDYRSLS